MRSKSGATSLLAAFLIVAMVLPAAVPAQKRASLATVATRELTQDQAILHALNRLGFGPRPGDLERVRQMGLAKFIDQQLNPASDPELAVQARLERYKTLDMSTRQLLKEYPQPKQAAKKAGVTPEEYRKRMEERKMEDRPDPAMRAAANGPQRVVAELSLAKLTRAVYSERQLQEVMVDFWFNHFNVFAAKGPDRWMLTEYERDVIRPRTMGKFRDLLGATASSSAMLFYLDNWLSADPVAAQKMSGELEQRREMMLARMNDPRAQERMRRAGRDPEAAKKKMEFAKQRMPKGLNENYARELMELHTLGVDGGYAQKDVLEVARAFTGWTLRAPRQTADFFFDDRLHDNGTKTVLGKSINAGGMKDGEAVLDLLARHPSTARFISTKLARRFVSDDPPKALVDRMAKSFTASDGDIRTVLRTMIEAPEFWSRETYRAKIKRPFELVASAVRATGADLDSPLPLLQWTERIGEPLYRCQPPTGYSDKAEAWVNTGALLNRMNFGVALAGNRLRGVRVDAASLLGAMSDDPLAKAIQVFLAGQVSPETRATLEKQLADQKPLPEVVAGLVLGSPEFQRR